MRNLILPFHFLAKWKQLLKIICLSNEDNITEPALLLISMYFLRWNCFWITWGKKTASSLWRLLYFEVAQPWEFSHGHWDGRVVWEYEWWLHDVLSGRKGEKGCNDIIELGKSFPPGSNNMDLTALTAAVYIWCCARILLREEIFCPFLCLCWLSIAHNTFPEM